MFELVFAGLAGYTHTLIHDDKRYGFQSVDAWTKATKALEQLRAALTYVDEEDSQPEDAA